MSKSKFGWDEKKINKYIRDGRGQGEGYYYKPWLTVRDVPSRGRQTRSDGWKTQRVHQLFSDNETRYFFLLEWSDKVVDIREQYPILDRDHTMTIAKRLGIRYPTDQQTKTPLVLTTDFLVTVLDNGEPTLWARTVKPAVEMLKERTREKLEIERQYWAELGVNWHVVIDRDIPRIMAENIEYVHSYFYLTANENSRLSIKDLEWIGEILKQSIYDDNRPIKKILKEVDDRTGVETGTALFMLRHLIATKQVEIDMTQKFDVRKLANTIKVVTIGERREKGNVFSN